MEGEKRNLGIKLTSHVLSGLKLMKMTPNSDFSNSNFQLPGYYSFDLTREKNRGGGLCIFLIHYMMNASQ